ncbi:DNA repair protein RecN [Leptolyngbya sp. 7M]|uniref:DNA repair protein RecN n=1 Tax=Leptolyngbya sp. 7M TaxID=2812896 RepID=UPI0021F0C861|nr:AAA family ATPase [Leptolyngbya sp. 7M]
MLSYLQINNIALIDELTVEFGPGLNLLTGETGSGKSIIVDSLGALTGDRVSSDLIKEGYDTARIEGLFALPLEKDLHSVLESGGIDIDPADTIELIVRRELTLSGRNRIFINNQLATAALLKRIGPFLVDIHGQGDQSSLFDPTSHLELLDTFAGSNEEISTTSKAFEEWRAVRDELADLKRDEAAKLQLVDVLRFQVDELSQAALQIGESEELGSEKRRLNNIEKLSALSSEAFSLLYEMDGSATSTLDQGLDRLRQLAEYDERFREYIEPLESAAAVISDAAFALRDFRSGLEFSPSRLEEIEERLAEISRLERKYGGSTVTALEHLAASEKRLANIETSELREKELTALLAAKHKEYIASATLLSEKRKAAAKQFELAVKNGMNQVALEKARFEIRFDSRPAEDYFTETGFDRIEFFFSANPGESPKPFQRAADIARAVLTAKHIMAIFAAPFACCFQGLGQLQIVRDSLVAIRLMSNLNGRLS